MDLLRGLRDLLRLVLGPVLDHVRAQERPVPRLIHLYPWRASISLQKPVILHFHNFMNALIAPPTAGERLAQQQL